MEHADDGSLKPSASLATKADQSALEAHITNTAGAHLASAIAFSPTGSISATDVQAAISEVAAELASGSVAFSDQAALNLAASASAGVATEAARADHVHSYAGLATDAELSDHTGDATIHRSINDSGTAATDLWSANKISTDLAGKAASSHTHTAANVTDFSEAVDDRVNTLIVAGSGVTKLYDDTANTLTLSASGGGVDSVNTQTGAVVLDADDIDDTSTTNKFASASQLSDISSNTAARHTHANSGVLAATTASFTTAGETKLNGIAVGATANSPDATLLARANHTGTQASSTISDFAETVRDTMGSALTAGSNITITPNDAGDSITIAATGGASPFIMSSDYGLDTTGTVDVSTALNNFLLDLSTSGRPGMLEPGTYRCEDVIWPKSNTTLYAYGATLVHNMPAVVGVNDWDQLFRIQHADNVKIIGLTVNGYQEGFPSDTEFRHAISILGGSNILLRDVVGYNAKGDGIYIGHHNTDGTIPPVNVVIEHVYCHDNYRQGMSVGSADGLYVSDSLFADTIGTLPACGIDIEPDANDQTCRDIHFTRCRFTGNDNQGVRISLIAGGQAIQHGISFRDCWIDNNVSDGVQIVNGVDVIFDGCTMEGNGDTVTTNGSGLNVVQGTNRNITVQNCFIRGNLYNGMVLTGQVASTTITGMQIIDNFIAGNATDDSPWGAGIQLGGVAAGTITDLLIARNTIGDVGEAIQGPPIQSHANVTIVNGRVHDNILRVSEDNGSIISGADALALSFRDNVGYVTRTSGRTGGRTDGGLINHQLAGTPTKAGVTGSVAGEIVTITTLGATALTIAIKKADGSSGTSQAVSWWAEM